MEAVSALVVDVELLVNVVSGSTHLSDEVETDVLEPEVARNVKWRPSIFISFNEQLKHIILALLYARIIGWIILVESNVKSLDNRCNLALVNVMEDTLALREGLFSKCDSLVYFLLLSEFFACIHFLFLVHFFIFLFEF